MNRVFFRGAFAVITAFGIVACGGGSGDSVVVSRGNPTEPTDPAVEILPDDTYPALSNRAATGTAVEMVYVVLDDGNARFLDAVTINASSGAITGGLLDGTVIDNAEYLNPANGEFSRIVRISDDNIFGAVGLDVQPVDLPTTGVTDYNEGWVGMTAVFSDNVYVLTGNAEFTVTWDGSGDIDGRFFNLSGTTSRGGTVTNEGTIILTNGSVTDDRFAGGTVTGTGLFDRLGGTSSTAGTQGVFFGRDADELGGVLLINDNAEDIQVIGAFQAD